MLFAFCFFILAASSYISILMDKFIHGLGYDSKVLTKSSNLKNFFLCLSYNNNNNNNFYSAHNAVYSFVHILSKIEMRCYRNS